jgi:hypothetical protein
MSIPNAPKPTIQILRGQSLELGTEETPRIAALAKGRDFFRNLWRDESWQHHTKWSEDMCDAVREITEGSEKHNDLWVADRTGLTVRMVYKFASLGRSIEIQKYLWPDRFKSPTEDLQYRTEPVGEDAKQIDLEAIQTAEGPTRTEILSQMSERAYVMRVAGFTDKDVPDTLGITEQEANEIIGKRAEQAKKRTVSQIKISTMLEIDRLDGLFRACYPEALSGSLGHVDRVLRIMERRAKLLGLDAVTLQDKLFDEDLDLSVLTEEELNAYEFLRNKMAQGLSERLGDSTAKVVESTHSTALQKT